MLFANTEIKADDLCHYTYSIWNTIKKTTVKTITVKKNRSDLNNQEIGPLGCTICNEDQKKIKLSNGLPLKICHKIAQNVKAALERAIKNGSTIKSIKGYRPSKSRGPLDKNGNRTLFSNHAYGVAVDINEKYNGLYQNCLQWSPKCRLIKGGRYNPKNPLSFTTNHTIVKEMARIDLKWGGHIKGTMKDFMHFSPDGM